MEASSAAGSGFGTSTLSGVFKDSAERQEDFSGTQYSNSGYHSLNGSTRSNHSSSGSQIATSGSEGENCGRVSIVGVSTSHNSSSSKDFIDAAGVTIELLQAEVDMWKQNSQRLMAELDKFRSELVTETKRGTSLQMELSEIHNQCNGLKKEVDKVRLLMEDQRKKEKEEAKEDEDKDNIKKEWEREMKFEKELNANLALQLKRSQEANFELVSVLREMEKQQIEGMDTYSISSEDNERTSGEDRDFAEDIRKEMHCSYIEETVVQKNAVINSLRHENMVKDKEIEGLKHCKQEEKTRIDENATDSLGKCGMDPPLVLGNDIISKTSLKLKSENDELEVQLLEVENENICLSERIIGLEAVLRHLTDEKESTCLLLRDSQSNVGKLQNKVCELEKEIMAQKLDLKEKLQNRQKKFFEALEESQILEIENKKLQATVESIMEENSLLQISNIELRRKKMDLQEHCAILEVEVKDTLELFSGILKEVENLEASFHRMLKEISLKEKSMNGELDALVREIQKHNANLARDDSLLNQMYLEKTAEVANLERKVVHLMKQMSTTFDENEREASEAVLELSCLREDKPILEAALQEAQGKLRQCESKIEVIHKEAERKVLGVKSELAISQQNLDILMDCHRKVLSSLQNVKNSESRLKNMLRRHECKLKAFENDRQNLAEEVSALNIKLQSMGNLQVEVLRLNKSLIQSEHQNKCLKASFEMLFEDYEKLKAKSVTYLEEISDMQKLASKLGDYKRSKTALEEKVWRLEWELTAKEASCTLQSKMKYELARLTRTNSQLKGKVKYLEEEKEDCFKRVQVREEKLKQHKEEMHRT